VSGATAFAKLLIHLSVPGPDFFSPAKWHFILEFESLIQLEVYFLSGDLPIMQYARAKQKGYYSTEITGKFNRS